MHRRAFLGRVAGVAGAAVVAPQLLRQPRLARRSSPGPGPTAPLHWPRTPTASSCRPGSPAGCIATSGQPVAGTGYSWHVAPDGGACFAIPGGGWVYVSNSEVPEAGRRGQRGAVPSGRVGRRGLPGPDRHERELRRRARRRGARGCPARRTGPRGRVYECDPQQPGQGVRRDALGSFAHEAAAVDPATGPRLPHRGQPGRAAVPVHAHHPRRARRRVAASPPASPARRSPGSR